MSGQTKARRRGGGGQRAADEDGSPDRGQTGGEKVDQAMKEEMTEVAAAEAVREETVITEGTAVAEKKKETEGNGRVVVASDPVAEKEDLTVRARKIMGR